jgi:hypothetical protein
MLHRDHFFETGIRLQFRNLVREEHGRENENQQQQRPVREDYAFKEYLFLTVLIGVKRIAVLIH